MPARERKKGLLRLADAVGRNSEELALLQSLGTGKPAADALAADLPHAIETVRWHAEVIDKLYDSVSLSASEIVSMIVREPIGIVAAVIPWNFKPAEQTPLTAIRLAILAAEAGPPDGVLSVLPGYRETTGQALGLHPDVNCVSFTGSTELGRLFLSYAADSNLKRIVLELGGKSPVIVLDDVKDLTPVVEQIAMGILFSQGENCIAGARLLVHEKMEEQLLEQVIATFITWKVGDRLIRPRALVPSLKKNI
jgi:4-(gamma-glutamylamino)butanal dehydrogenase